MWKFSSLSSESASGIGLRRWQRGWHDEHTSCGWRWDRPDEGHATEAWKNSHRGPGADMRTELSRRLSGRASACLGSSLPRGIGLMIQGCLARLRCPRSGGSWARICWSTWICNVLHWKVIIPHEKVVDSFASYALYRINERVSLRMIWTY